jgi:hypothetical protein
MALDQTTVHRVENDRRIADERADVMNHQGRTTV